MNYMKVGIGVLAGAAAGIGICAAAPVFGTIGVISGIGMLVGGGTGAVVGGVATHAFDDSDKVVEAE